MTDELRELSLYDPSDLTLTSDGYGEFPNGYKLTAAGIRKVRLATGGQFLYAEFCRHPDAVEGDGIHVAGEPSDLICLESPVN